MSALGCVRMAEVGRGLGRSPSPTPAEQGRLEHPAQDGIQAGTEDLQGRRLCNLSGQPDPALCHLTVQKCPLILTQSFLCFSLCLLLLLCESKYKLFR